MKTHAQAAMSSKQELRSWSYDLSRVADFELLLKVTHCGVCHSDLHLIDDDWGVSSYPLVPGHEIIGEVLQTGSQVHALEPGQRVGVGWQRSSCLHCEQCLKGHENLCSRQEATCVGHHGGFGHHIVVDSRFAFRIPDGLEAAATAPLLCGGITVYSPLQRFVRPGDRVGVVGIGGLGHLALRFARAMGCEVTAYSTTENKKSLAQSLGAHHFVNTTDADWARRSPPQDLVLTTVMANLPWTDYLRVLRPDGHLCFVGVPTEDVRISVNDLMSRQKSIGASSIGNRSQIIEMLSFCELHKIGAQVEVFGLDQVNQALRKVRENSIRFRAVLQMS